MSQTIMKTEEKVAFALRALYKKYGYLPYKMSKFEAYDLYVANKDFLVGDGVITFNDTDGKLLALKPDVTLSIIKNFGEADGFVKKLCYDENVYRVPRGGRGFREIMQASICSPSAHGRLYGASTRPFKPIKEGLPHNSPWVPFGFASTGLILPLRHVKRHRVCGLFRRVPVRIRQPVRKACRVF